MPTVSASLDSHIQDLLYFKDREEDPKVLGCQRPGDAGLTGQLMHDWR